MKQFLSVTVVALLASASLYAQKTGTLTVEKIMRDPKQWIGTAPSNVRWSEDSKTIYFDWNPDRNLSDSLYAYTLADKKIVRVGS